MCTCMFIIINVLKYFIKLSVCRVRATNPLLGKDEFSQYLRINTIGGSQTGEIAPYFVVKPKGRHVIKGHKTTELQCIANARPLHELGTLWFKDDIPIENTNGIDYIYNDPWNRTLSLINAKLTYTGRYTCQIRFLSGGYLPISSDADIFVLGLLILQMSYIRVNIRPNNIFL